MGKLFFISDLHFGHKNCLSYDARPFKTTEENDAELIRRWNEAVGFDDEVWILGDIGYYSVTRLIAILQQLNGLKHLCVGNHDHKYLKNQNFRAQFAEITHYKEIDFGNGNGVVLCHYPIPCFNRHYQGWYHLYGHVHNSFEWNMMERIKFEMAELYEKPCKMFNVGAMMPYMDYTPRTLDEIVSTTVSDCENLGI